MKLLKFVPLCLIEWQIKFNRFLNAETIKTQKDLNECGHNRKFLEHPVRYHLLILGTCRHTVFYRENAAAFFSRLLRQKIAPEQLRFGTIHDINTEENRLNGNCWVYQNFFIEIGYKTRFGYFDDRCFFFKENLGNFRITLTQSRRKSSIYRKILEYSLQNATPVSNPKMEKIEVDYRNVKENQWQNILIVNNRLSLKKIKAIIKMF